MIGAALWAVGIMLTAVEAVLFVSAPAQPWQALLFSAAAVTFISAGVLAWIRRPSNRMGPLLYLSGIIVVLAGLQNTSSPGLVAVGLILGVVPIATVLHGLLAFPSGRLGRGLPLVLVTLGYLITVLVEAPAYLFAQPTPIDPLQIAHDPTVAHVCRAVGRWSELGVLLCGAAVLVVRLRAATPQQRRLLGPLYGYGVLTLLTLELAADVLPGLIGAGPLTVFAVQIIALAGVPVIFATTMLRGGFARSGTLDELGMWLAASGAERSRLRETLAETLGDPQLELLFRLDDSDGYVRGDGAPAQAPTEASGRAAVAIEHAGEPIGLIVYDAALIADAEWVRAAGRVIAIAFERERLTAALIASRESLQESRERIVAVQDRERRRIARDLHDRLQGRLVAVTIEAGRIANRPETGTAREGVLRIRDDLERSLDELRDIVQDITPALLVERGLFSATRELLDSLPLHARLSETGDDQHLADQVASTGYAFVSETLTNVMKHAEANHVEVGLRCDATHLRIEISDDGVGGATIRAETGLGGIADRLGALNGRLELESPPGAGTTVRVELPCAS